MRAPDAQRAVYWPALVALLAGADDADEPDVAKVYDDVLEEIRTAHPFDVAIGALGLICQIAGELSSWTGQSRDDIISAAALVLAQKPPA